MKLKCFVVMPFNEDCQQIYESIFRPVCKLNNVECNKADDNQHQGAITTAIIASILEADFIIADLSGNNPNVFYELGIALSIGKKVIQVSQQAFVDIPFDVKLYRTIKYSQNQNDVERVKKDLDASIKALIHGDGIFINPMHDLISRYLWPYGPLEGGLIEFKTTFHGYPHKETLRNSDEMLIVLNDGRSWIDTYREALKERSEGGKRTSIVLIHPKSSFISTLIKKNGKQLSTQLDELRRSYQVISDINNATQELIDIRGHHVFNPYSLFLTEDKVTIMPYFYNESGELPLMTFANSRHLPLMKFANPGAHFAPSLYSRFKDDAYELFNKSLPLNDTDFG
jgi:hypothetical protein